MRYRHTLFDETVNVTRTHPLSGFISYLAAIIVLMGVIFFASALAVELLIPHVSPKMEARIWQHFLQQEFSQNTAERKQSAAQQRRLQALLDRIPTQGLPHEKYEVIVLPNAQINAMALPSGKIVVFSGLLNAIKTENAVVFMLGHELGHFANRDHLRGMGRSLILAVILAPLLSDESSNAFLKYIQSGYNSFSSREQEIAADSYGLQVLIRVYGHAGGATELFDVLREEEESPRALEYFSTHPLSAHRIDYLKDSIAKDHLPVRATTAKTIGKI